MSSDPWCGCGLSTNHASLEGCHKGGPSPVVGTEGRPSGRNKSLQKEQTCTPRHSCVVCFFSPSHCHFQAEIAIRRASPFWTPVQLRFPLSFSDTLLGTPCLFLLIGSLCLSVVGRISVSRSLRGGMEHAKEKEINCTAAALPQWHHSHECGFCSSLPPPNTAQTRNWVAWVSVAVRLHNKARTELTHHAGVLGSESMNVRMRQITALTASCSCSFCSGLLINLGAPPSFGVSTMWDTRKAPICFSEDKSCLHSCISLCGITCQGQRLGDAKCVC